MLEDFCLRVLNMEDPNRAFIYFLFFWNHYDRLSLTNIPELSAGFHQTL